MMQVIASVHDVRKLRWSSVQDSWGLVPTMGYLHDGHLSLVRRARNENERLAISIYVNPTQFSPDEDLATYPRDLERDLRMLSAEDVDLAFTPTDELMYPPGYQTVVSVQEISRVLEGSSRPQHFQGVTTIVTKLLNIVQPTRVYFGQKDAQQVAVIRRLVEDLNIDTEVVVCPTIREHDGVAMSSRNVRLSPAQRDAAPVLFRSLEAARERLSNGERNAERLRQLMRDTILTEPMARLDYASAADPDTLLELALVKDRVLLSLAVFLGRVRLIDNMLVSA